MILMIDNYDSFTYNLVDYCGKISDLPIEVFRNDKISISEIKDKSPSYIIISPGPKEPKDAGISKDVVSEFSGKVPILGVCLGHQCIGEVFGGKTVHAKRLMHGKTSFINYVDHPLFYDIPNPFEATRYHSLVIEKSSFPDDLIVLAHSDDDDEIMALVHKDHPTYGVQFHPESICSPEGLVLLKNFLSL
ncbi:anthranilate/aminodeoxychorismate synthase component II [Candidatus Marinamargulisbacteria bacterium SCGC AG-343-D04]|nr:anthranilate/aminodeoxychorismate synthase component II [Candidatus Marinamargulisbacteria bacterium SCGC AG-343-D04]